MTASQGAAQRCGCSARSRSLGDLSRLEVELEEMSRGVGQDERAVGRSQNHLGLCLNSTLPLSDRFGAFSGFGALAGCERSCTFRLCPACPAVTGSCVPGFGARLLLLWSHAEMLIRPHLHCIIIFKLRRATEVYFFRRTLSGRTRSLSTGHPLLFILLFPPLPHRLTTETIIR